ncbi:MAG: L-serine ammonia-lyase, iron-sulfur-dependent subunit beta [Puniceicoccales bacterium]|jgi:L-serine dehydratase|nr:L-serine ammonia-lyase, iron-sulfur-dependent subunit beta [Puniceicoccales bacterium]
MNISAFDVIGPAMIGPSSSHTAGAVRIGLISRALAGGHVADADIIFHGSFAATGKGHATDRGIVAGLLGLAPDDERLKESLALAAQQGVAVRFSTEDLGEDFHPNTVRVLVHNAKEPERRITASSVGGGMIRVVRIDRFATDFSGELPTLVLWHYDSPGFLAKITTLLACVEANIASIHTARRARGNDALTVIEVDAPLPAAVINVVKLVRNVARVVQLPRFL